MNVQFVTWGGRSWVKSVGNNDTTHVWSISHAENGKLGFIKFLWWEHGQFLNAIQLLPENTVPTIASRKNGNIRILHQISFGNDAIFTTSAQICEELMCTTKQSRVGNESTTQPRQANQQPEQSFSTRETRITHHQLLETTRTRSNASPETTLRSLANYLSAYVRIEFFGLSVKNGLSDMLFTRAQCKEHSDLWWRPKWKGWGKWKKGSDLPILYLVSRVIWRGKSKYAISFERTQAEHDQFKFTVRFFEGYNTTRRTQTENMTASNLSIGTKVQFVNPCAITGEHSFVTPVLKNSGSCKEPKCSQSIENQNKWGSVEDQCLTVRGSEKRKWLVTAPKWTHVYIGQASKQARMM